MRGVGSEIPDGSHVRMLHSVKICKFQDLVGFSVETVDGPLYCEAATEIDFAWCTRDRFGNQSLRFRWLIIGVVRVHTNIRNIKCYRFVIRAKQEYLLRQTGGVCDADLVKHICVAANVPV